MKKLVIIATKFNQTPEAEEVFNQRKWGATQDNSSHSGKRRLIEKDRHSTPLIGLDWEWSEYE